MNYISSKHRELSEQLVAWWARQADFKTKKALASQLGIHPDTLGDYFAGRKFPQSDIAGRLSNVAGISCLSSYTASSSALAQNAASAGTIANSTAQPENAQRSGVTPEVSGQQPLSGLKERQGNVAVVISLQRTGCPFCGHSIEGFHYCLHCGQHFIWANVPIGPDNASEHDDLSAQSTTSGNSR